MVEYTTNLIFMYYTLQKCFSKHFNNVPLLFSTTNFLENIPPFPIFYYLSILNCILSNYLIITHLNINYNILNLILQIIEKMALLFQIQIYTNSNKYINNDRVFVKPTSKISLFKNTFCNSSLFLNNNPLCYEYINKNISVGILQRVLEIRRVTKTTKSGRTRKFRVILAIGTKTGWLGLGVGKGLYLADATAKARKFAFKNIYYFKLTKTGSIPAATEAIFKKSKIIFKPLPIGRGLIAPELIRKLCEVIGYRNIWSSLIGSSNKVNVIKATLLAFTKLTNKSKKIYSKFYDKPSKFYSYKNLFSIINIK